MLFTEEVGGQTHLSCFIELFSTFSYYVILNSNYTGPAKKEYYYQTVLKQELPLFDISERVSSPKELSILLQEMGVSYDELSGKNMQECIDYLKKKSKQRTPKYKLDLNITIKQASNQIMQVVLAKKSGIPFGFSETQYQYLDFVENLGVMDLLLLREELIKIDKMDVLEHYKQEHFASPDGKAIHLYSTLDHCVESVFSNYNLVRKNTRLRFRMLQYFISQNALKQL